METPPGEDVHRYYSAHCFNETWALIDKPERTSEDDEQMLLRAQASLWHWTQRSDCTERNRSIGYWLLSRVHALLGEAENARRFGRRCLDVSPMDDAFCRGYAHEALARAAILAGDAEDATGHLAEARGLLERVADAENRALLENDLAGLEG